MGILFTEWSQLAHSSRKLVSTEIQGIFFFYCGEIHTKFSHYWYVPMNALHHWRVETISSSLSLLGMALSSSPSVSSSCAAFYFASFQGFRWGSITMAALFWNQRESDQQTPRRYYFRTGKARTPRQGPFLAARSVGYRTSSERLPHIMFILSCRANWRVCFQEHLGGPAGHVFPFSLI